MIDKLVLKTKNELVVVYTDKAPVTIVAPDAYATWLWLQAPTSLSLPEFELAVIAESEETCVNIMISKVA